MRFSPDDVVLRVHLNLERVHTAEAALRAWLPLVAELHPLAMEFEAAEPSGLRRGFMADLLVVVPRTDGENTGDQLLASVAPIIERLGLDVKRFEVDDAGTGGQVSVRDEHTTGKDAGKFHGAYLLFAMIGADPLNPDGDETDYHDAGEDLL
ncbi:MULTISPECIES: hypothetical protein [unclassified Streptomyces]|uniref:hypothetical protein n=1 Tax=unclassified Streptomyces TaxID=2593676 RepID=UPI002E298841|nr:hypothetical protein [Streptomyces sp. NBC_01429]